ncbi:MAG: response regulator [Gaiellaceae bacterium]
MSCLVADDHPAMVEAVCDVLNDHGVAVVGRAADGDEALAKIEARRPDTALVDLRMPGLSGIELATNVKSVSPDTRVIVYSAYGEGAVLTEALDAGASGFVLKEAPLTDLLRAIETVAAGGVYVDPVLAGSHANASVAESVPSLSQRERAVLRLLADGHSNEEIGQHLFISAETVRTHVRRIATKLGARTRTQAVATALRNSLIA